MKNTIKYFGTATLKAVTIFGAAATLFACVRSNEIPQRPVVESGYGTLELPAPSTITVVEDARDKDHTMEDHGDTRGAQTRAVDTSNFLVTIERTGNDAKTICTAKPYSELVAEGPMTLMVGTYTLYVESHVQAEAPDWNLVHYSATRTFEIQNQLLTYITDIQCKVSNILVSVKFTADMVKQMGADVDQAWVEISFGGGDPLTYTKAIIDEGRRGTFKATEATNAMRYDFHGVINNVVSDQFGTINNVKAGEHRTLTFDVLRDGEGNATFEIGTTVTCTTYDINKNINVGEQEIIEPFVKPTTLTSNFSLVEPTEVNLFSEATLPAAMWVKVEAGAGISSLKVKIISDWTTLILNNAFKTDEGFEFAKDVNNSALPGKYVSDYLKFPYNANVLNKKEVMIDIMPYIKGTVMAFATSAGYGGTPYFAEGANHTLDFTFTASDNSDPVDTKSETLSLSLVRKDPNAAAALSIVGVDGYTIGERVTIDQTEKNTKTVNIHAIAPEKISEFWVEITSSKDSFLTLVRGMFGNEEGAPAKVDLANASGDLGQNLIDVGLPAASDIKGKDSFTFGVNAGFLELLFSGVLTPLPQTVDFKITVKDEKGDTAEGVIKLNLTDTTNAQQ